MSHGYLEPGSLERGAKIIRQGLEDRNRCAAFARRIASLYCAIAKQTRKR
jgi:hypothetical protein